MNGAEVSNDRQHYIIHLMGVKPGKPMLRTSWGFGFRWFSPIGPLRFEWGIPLVKQPGEERIVFEFTIGNFF